MPDRELGASRRITCVGTASIAFGIIIRIAVCESEDERTTGNESNEAGLHWQ